MAIERKENKETTFFYVFFFCIFISTGVIWVNIKKSKTRLVSQACNASHQNQGTAVEFSLKIQVSKLNFPTGLGLYVWLSNSKLRQIVKPPCTLLNFRSSKREKNIYLWTKIICGNCQSFELVSRIDQRMVHFLMTFVLLE